MIMIEINGLIDWFIHWFVDWLNIQMGCHNLSVQCLMSVYSQAGCIMPIRLRGGGGGKRGPVRGHVLKQGVQSEGRWREKGGRFGEIGRLGASVRREESWEVQWWSNFCHHWTTQQSPSQWFYSHHAWSHDPRAWCRHRGQTTERQQRHQPTFFFCLFV